MNLISLTTDFGLSDWFVGSMKGVIAGIQPDASVVDLTHGISPGDIHGGAFALAAAYDSFPKRTIHVVVIDPGVGSPRPAIAVRTRRYDFVAPDNGVLSLVLDQNRIDGIVRITNEQLWRQPVSTTFHGRDIMAPVAGHLSRGLALDRLGPSARIEDLQRLAIEPARLAADGTLQGKVLLIDHFGNLVTNIDAHQLERLTADDRQRAIEVRLGTHRINGLSENYAAGPLQAPLAIVGSHGFLEIAVNCGRADRVLAACPGDALSVSCGSAPDKTDDDQGDWKPSQSKDVS